MEIDIEFNDTFQAPIGSPRPRFRVLRGYVQTYMPSSYTNHKNYIQSQMPKVLSDKNLKVYLCFYFTPPKSWSKKRKLIAIGTYKRTKPDVDNLIKTVLDAANNHVWQDDNQVVHIESYKMYAEESKIVMVIKEVD